MSQSVCEINPRNIHVKKKSIKKKNLEQHISTLRNQKNFSVQSSLIGDKSKIVDENKIKKRADSKKKKRKKIEQPHTKKKSTSSSSTALLHGHAPSFELVNEARIHPTNGCGPCEVGLRAGDWESQLILPPILLPAQIIWLIWHAEESSLQ